MARAQHNPDEAFGSDSFLDIVANMVGILIILVIIAGLRAKGIPQQLVEAATDIANEIRLLTSKGSTIEHDNHKLNHEVELIKQAQATLDAEQQQLAVARDQLRSELERRRKDLDSQSQSDFDLRRKLAAAEGQFQRVNLELAEAAKVQPRVATKIESYPTPLSQTVAGKELHFQIKNKRVVYVPLDELVDLFKSEVRQRAYQLKQKDEATDTIGPIGGFRMRFTLERVDMPVQVGSVGVVTGSFARLEEFHLVPTNPLMGETLEEARAPGSQFRKKVGNMTPERTTVTLWTYPDSFELYRDIRKELYLAGYMVAGRPMPEGQPIGGSPQGTKSAAQ
jgi:hypothetical protein